jgi:nanoRNase/pAp phosphatase (c-di-AMP/oligoRNAs hydrolase)
MKANLVIYHGPSCLDGIAAAWCMHQWLGDAADYEVGRYQTELDVERYRDKMVYLVDFSFKPAEMARILEVAKMVYVIDHHKSALEALEEFPKKWDNIDMSYCSLEKSGAMLAWEFVNKQTGWVWEVPTLLKHIQDRDLWQFKLEWTKEITTALFSLELDYKSIHKYMTNPTMYTLINDGILLLKVHAQDCANLIKYSKRTMFFYTAEFDEQNDFVGEDCVVIDIVNCPAKYSSDVGNMIAEVNGLGGSYFDTETHREFSLRSKGDIDVSEIAKAFGGGGHKNAAGFKVLRSHPLAKA